jgi:hypothetical protein
MLSREGVWCFWDEWTDPSVNRCELLAVILDEVGLRRYWSTIESDGALHFVVAPNADAGVGVGLTALAAHYDRTKGSPGANDNGVAVFLLMETALKLLNEGCRNWFILFTDKEELGRGEPLTSQGSYTLGKVLLRRSGRGFGRVFNFDSCGRGDTFIVSTTPERLLKKANGIRAAQITSSLTLLRVRALAAAHKAGIERLVLAPTPFSDDAGFLLAGLPVQTITVLPADEAALFTQATRGKSNWTPPTWRLINSPLDATDTLTEKNFPAVKKLMYALASSS